MPLARIVTRIPETAASLASYLNERGYRVEVVAPGQILVSDADVELTLETCASSRALDQAAKLASRIDADVVVSPGAIPEPEPKTKPADTPLPAKRDSEAAPPSRHSQRSQALRETAYEWRRQGQEKFTAISQLLSAEAHTLRERGLKASAEWNTRAGKSVHVWLLFLRQKVHTGALAMHAGLRRAWLKLEDGVRLRALAARQRRENKRQEDQRRIQAIALRRQQRQEAEALEALKLRAQQEQSPVTTEPAHFVEPEPEEPVIQSVAPSILRTATRKRSPLVAYTRNRGRDWKMAFLGAVTASAVIMLISMSAWHKALPQNDAQQRLPFGPATTQPRPPVLMIQPPATAPIPIPVAAKKAVPVAPKPQVAPAPETQSQEEDDYVEDVVVRHYRTHQSAKARSDEDGVKRISDLE